MSKKFVDVLLIILIVVLFVYVQLASREIEQSEKVFDIYSIEIAEKGRQIDSIMTIKSDSIEIMQTKLDSILEVINDFD